MNDTILQQARALYATMQRLRTRTLVKHAPENFAPECTATELTLPQMTTMAVIRDKGEMSVKELAEATQVSRPSASAMVERLVELGVLIRRPSEIDRREVRISLSEEGELAVNTMETQILQSMAEILQKIGPEYANQMCDVYERISEVLDEEQREGAVADAAAAVGD